MPLSKIIELGQKALQDIRNTSRDSGAHGTGAGAEAGIELISVHSNDNTSYV